MDYLLTTRTKPVLGYNSNIIKDHEGTMAIAVYICSFLYTSLISEDYLQFALRPKDVDTYAGLSVTLDCAAEGVPAPTNIFWLHGNQQSSFQYLLLQNV